MSSDGSADEIGFADPEAVRSSKTVGKVQHLPGAQGACVGDDVSWRGSMVCRVVCLQTAGAGGSLTAWGHWWGLALKELGADVGILTETRIDKEYLHAQAIAGLLDADYLALSHNTGELCWRRQAPELHDARSSGVIIGVRAEYVGAWEAIGRDKEGRALAANLVMQNGVVMRTVGVYGVTGACLVGFRHSVASLEAERAVVAFIRRQADLCDQHGWHLLVRGDLNSFTSAALDRWGVN